MQSRIIRVIAGGINPHGKTRAILAAGLLGVFVATGILTAMPRTAVAATGINKQINFQGKVTNTNGTNVANGSYTFVFKLYTVSTAGSAVWTETKSLTVTDGIFQTALGSTTSLPGSIDFNTDNIYLGITFNGDPEMTPRIQFTATPYSFNSDLLDGLDASAFAQLNPSSAQTGSLNVTGTVQAATSLQAPVVDTATGVGLVIGGTNATSVTVGKVTTSLALQGNSASTFSAHSGANSTTLSFTAPTATNAQVFQDASGVIPLGTTGNTLLFTTSGATNLTLPTSGTVTVNPASGSFLKQVPASSAENTITPTANSVVGLTVNGTSGTSAAALSVIQTGGSPAILVNTSNGGAGIGVTNSSTANGIGIVNSGTGIALGITSTNSGTQSSALSITRNSSGTTTNLISLTNGGGTVSSGINFSGTYTNLISSGTFQVSNAGAVTAVGVDSGSGLLQGTGGLTLTGAVSLNSTGSSTNSIGNAGSGALTVQGNASSTIVANSGANSTTVGFTTPTGTNSILFPNAGGTVCTTVASTCGGATGAYVALQSATPGTAQTGHVNLSGTGIFGTSVLTPLLDTAAAGTLALGTTSATAIALNQNTTILTNKTFTANGSALFQPATDTTSAFNIKTSAANNQFTVDTTSGRVGISLGSNNIPTLQGQGLEINGALRLSGGAGSVYTDTFTTPVGASVDTKINIPLYNPGNFGQLVAMGLPSSANSSSRALSLFDARTVAHQPTLGVFSPDENNLIGFSWDGSNSQALLKGTGSDIAINANGLNVARFENSGSNALVTLGANALLQASPSNKLDITANAASTWRTATGNLTVDSAAVLQLGTSTATSLTVGKTAVTTTINGVTQLGASAGTGSLVNNGTTTNATLALGDLAAGVLGTAAATVDIYTGFSIAPTTSGRTYTIPTPTASTAYGRTIYISNIASAGNSFILLGTTMNPGATATLVWANTSGGASWQFAGADGNGILNQNTADQTADFRISGTGRANTSFTSPKFDSITGGVSLGLDTATTVTIGGTTNTTGITLQGATGASYTLGTTGGTGTITVGQSTASNSISIGGGATANGNTQTIGIGNGAAAGTGKATIVIGNTNGASGVTIQAGTSGVVFGSGAGQGFVTHNGATVMTTLPVADDANGGPLGAGLSAAASVDVYTSIAINQTTASQTITLPTPTASTTYGRLLYVSNIGTASFILLGTTMNPGATATLIWSNKSGGDAWQFAGADGNGILNQNTADQTADFRISGTGRANTSFISPLVDSITGGLSIGTSTATGVTIGGTTNTTAVSLQGAVGASYTIGTTGGTGTITVGQSTASNSISIGGGATATGNTQTIGIGNGTPAGTGKATITIGNTNGASGVTLQGGTAGITLGSGAGQGQLTNNGSTVMTTLAVANDSDGGALGGTPGTPLTAAQSVDVYTSIAVNQTTASQTITLPTPTANTTYGRLLYLSNVGNVSFTLLGATMNPGTTATLIWSNTTGGAAWQFAGADGNAVLNQNTADQSANFRISGTGRANTSFTSPLFDSITGVLGLGTNTATGITLGGTTTTGTISIGNSAASTISIGTGNQAHTIGIGTDSGTIQGVTMGSTFSTSTTILQAGTGDLNLRSSDLITLQNGAGSTTIATFDTSASATQVGLISGALTANAAQNSLTLNTTFTPTTDAARTYAGVNSTPTFSGNATNFDTITFAGVNSLATYNGTGGRLFTAIGGRFGVSNTNVRTLQNAYGVQVLNTVNSGGGTVTSAAGIAVADQTVGTNRANLILGSTTIPAATWSLYNSSTLNNALAGSTRFGSTTAPTATVDITGGLTQATGAFSLTGDAASQISTTTGALTITSAAAATWSTLDMVTPATAGPALTIRSAAGNTSGVGGNLTLAAGAGGNTAIGGTASLTGGAAGGGNTNGGQAIVQGGAATGTGTGGTASLLGGVAGAALSGSSGGGVTIAGQIGATGTTGVNGGAGGALNISSGTGGAGTGTNNVGGNGADINITAGTGGVSTGTAANSNGGSIRFTAGNAGTGGSGANGTPGVVFIDTPTFTAATTTTVTGNQTLAQSDIDNFSTIPVNATGSAGWIVSVPTPRNSTVGRIVYITGNNGSLDFTLRPSGSGSNDISMKANSTATLVYNGVNWTAAGADASTSLQQVYNNTATAPVSILTTSSSKTLLFQAGAGFDAANLFVVANAAGSASVAVDSSTTNLIANGSIEANPLTNWIYSGTAGSVARSTAEQFVGAASLNITTNNGANDGAKQTLSTTLTASTAYSISWYAKLSSGTFTNIIASYAYDGTTQSSCTGINTQTVTTTGWTRFTCTFTTGSAGTAPTASNAIFIKQTSAAVRTFFIDGVQLDSGAAYKPFRDSSIQLNGVVTSPVSLVNTNNSTNAFTIQNSAATSTLFRADTLNDVVVIGDSTNNVTFASTREPTLAGTARHTKNLIFTAEFAGAVLDADGTSNLGTMTAAFEATQRFGYYKWVTAQSTAQDFDIVLTVPVPDDYSAWTGTPTFWNYGSAGSTMTVTLTDTAGTVATNYNGATLTTSTTWTARNVTTPAITGTYTQGSNMIIRIHMTAAATTGDVRLGTITIPYLTRY